MAYFCRFKHQTLFIVCHNSLKHYFSIAKSFQKDIISLVEIVQRTHNIKGSFTRSKICLSKTILIAENATFYEIKSFLSLHPISFFRATNHSKTFFSDIAKIWKNHYHDRNESLIQIRKRYIVLTRLSLNPQNLFFKQTSFRKKKWTIFLFLKVQFVC